MMTARFIAFAIGLIGIGVLLFLMLPRYPDVTVPQGYDVNNTDLIAQGKYLAGIGGCQSCHQVEGGGAPYAGGRRIETPFGDFISPNITSDEQSGIGDWSAAEFLRLMQHGVLPSGQPSFPAFPWGHYRLMTQDDALAIYAYLQSLPPVDQSERGNDLAFPFSVRPLQRGWRLLFMPTAPDISDRGAYLVHALGHCGACHTPRNQLGGRDGAQLLKGVVDNTGRSVVPDLTGSGPLSDWSEDELAEFLTSGIKPDFDTVEGEMALVIEHGTSQLTKEDLLAMVRYLKQLPK